MMSGTGKVQEKPNPLAPFPAREGGTIKASLKAKKFICFPLLLGEG